MPPGMILVRPDDPKPLLSREAYLVLGVRVDAVQIPDVIVCVEEWIARREGCRFIAVTGMHGVTEAQHDAQFKAVLSAADLVVPDGMPLVWLGRRKGFSLPRRVYGPELMLQFCEESAKHGYRHFFYGGAPGLALRLAESFAADIPGFVVAGTLCPPFRPLTLEEDEGIISAIERSQPDIVWVGLSTPKQERWMYEHRNRLRVPAMIGVGAAFDINSGELRQAPYWMREHGLEWLFRLLQEPRRLWRRYLVYGTQFAFYVLLELSGLRRFE